MKLTYEAQAVSPPVIGPTIRTRIMISRLDPPHVVELVEYSDGRFGIQQDGVAVAQPWELARIEACVRSYCTLAENGRARLPAPPGAAEVVPQQGS